MKKLAFLLASAAAVAAVPVQAREGQLYLGIEGGVSFDDQVTVDIDNNRADGLLDNAAFADTNLGIDGDVILGYDFGAFRLEAEGGYKQAGYESLTVVNSGILPGNLTVPSGTVVQNDRNLKILSGMINGLIEFGKDDGLQIYGGGGVGLARLSLPVEVAGIGTVVDDNATDFAWQLIGGLRFPVNDNIDFGVKYRYFVAENFGLEAANGRALDVDYTAHSVLASLVYNFGGAPAPAPVIAAPAQPAPVIAPPPPRPAPPPPPRAQCNTGPFIVFFDFDRSDITAEASTILNNAVTAYANCGNARVMLAGHTDTSGSATYNLALAERRNASVRNYMTGRGVGAGQITGEAFGESQPRVPTADGVREAQNRRVEVSYGPGSGF